MRIIQQKRKNIFFKTHPNRIIIFAKIVFLKRFKKHTIFLKVFLNVFKYYALSMYYVSLKRFFVPECAI